MLLVGGVTFAYFSDTATNEGNSFTAGTVSVLFNRNDGEPNPGPMFYTDRANGWFEGSNDPHHPGSATGLWYPGKMETRTGCIHNQGNLAVDISGFSAAWSENSVITDAQKTHFAKDLNITITGGSNDTTLWEGRLSSLLSGEQPTKVNPRVSRGPSDYNIKFTAEWVDDNDDNDLQGVVPIVDFSVYVKHSEVQ